MSIFEGIGRVGDYAQMKNLRRDMQYRIRTGRSLAQALGMPQDLRKTQSSALLPPVQESDELRSMRIRQKLRQGQKLSGADMQYLKDADPDLYEQVLRIEARREELARALKRAKTKEEALRAVTLANISVLAEMRASGGAAAPGLRAAMQQGAAGSAAAAGASAAAAGEHAAAVSGGDASLPAETAAEPRSAEMNAAIAGEAIGQGVAGEAAAQEAPDAAHTEDPTPAEETQATREFGGRRVLTPAEKDNLRRSARSAAQLTPLDNEHIYQLRAYQREWMQYAASEAYKNLPDTALDAAREELRGGRRKRRSAAAVTPPERPALTPAEVLAAAQRYYYTLHDRERFIMRG